MKLFTLFLFSALSLQLAGQADTSPITPCKVGGLNIQKAPSSETQIRFYCRVQRSDTCHDPVLMVDGKIVHFGELSKINPDEISSISILKGAKAAALFGPQGAFCGAIIINKKFSYKHIRIKDAVDSNAIPAAIISFEFPGDKGKINYVADDEGRIACNSWKEVAKCEMTVSSVGYEPSYFKTPVQDSIIYLKRNFQACPEVILGGGGMIIGCRGGTTSYSWSVISDCRLLFRADTTVNALSALRNTTAPILVYPNPVERGRTVTLSFNPDKDNKFFVEVLDMTGNVLQRSQTQLLKNGLLQIQTKSTWPAGMYIIRLLYENNQPAASQKIILH